MLEKMLSVGLSVVRDDGNTGPNMPLMIDDIIRQYSAYVASITYKMVGNPVEVDDLVQDVFIDAQRGLHSLRDPNALRGWLAKIAVRRSRKYLKQRRLRRMIGLDEIPAYHAIADRKANPEQRAQIADVYRILDHVAPNKRIAWVLRYVEGESMKRITSLLECSRATAHRWIAEVQGILEEVLNDD